MPPPGPKKTTSAVWDYFTLDPREACVAVCTMCQKQVRRGKDGGTRPGTTALHKHLQIHHRLHVMVDPPSPLRLLKKRPHGDSTAASDPTPTSPLASPERNQPYYPPTHPTAIQLASDTTRMLAVDMQPFSHVEREGFLRLMAVAQPRWKVPGRTFFATKAMPELVNDLSRTVCQAVACSVGRTIHIAIHTWRSCRTCGNPGSSQAVSYMSVTGCWVAELGGLLSRQHAALTVCAFEGIYTEVDISQKLRDVLQGWLCGLKIGGVVSDNSTKVATAVEKLSLERVPCLAHCLKMVVKNFLAADRKLALLLKKARGLYDYYSHSAAAQRRLLEAEADLGLCQPTRPETPARSPSALKMLEYIFQQRQASIARLGQVDVASRLHQMLADWNVVRCLVDILKLFEDAASLVAHSSATLCQALPLLWFLEEQLEALRNKYCQENNKTGVCLTTQALVSLVCNREVQVMKNSMVYRVAAFLDPRFRDVTTMKRGTDTIDATLLRKHVIDLATKCYVPPGPDADILQAGHPSLPSSSSNPPVSAAWQFTMKQWRAITKSNYAADLATEVGAAVAIQEVESYLRDNVDHVGENADPMLYWQDKMAVWPTLFKVAVFHCGCPPTLAFSEDLPKVTGCHKDLSPADIKVFTFVQQNRHLILQDWQLSVGDLTLSQSAVRSRENMDLEKEG